MSVKHTTVFADFETFYSDEYSLRKMTPVEYILDPRFEANGCAFKEGVDSKPFWVDGPDLQAYFDNLDPEITHTVTHNALFDACIMTWRFGFTPRLIVDTMGVARAVLGHLLRSVSLESVSQHLGLGAKGQVLKEVKGMNLDMIRAAGLYDRYVAYGIDDVEKCFGIYDKLVRSGIFPASELVVMDTVLRCAIEPKFVLDRLKLAEHLAAVKASKETMLAKAMLLGAGGKADLMSNEAFAELLRGVGVEPPTKISPVTGKQAYAFAKTDVDFVALQEHDDPGVQALVAARMGHKSTLEESRCERLVSISNLQWPAHVTRTGNPEQIALLPAPLRYSAAHTHRLGGDWKLNLQNLPTRQGNELRRALTAPPGHSVVTVDAAQIEARIVAWICGQLDLVEQFARDEDVYSIFASDIFGLSVNKGEHPEKRFVGKTGILQLGFGAGAPKFQWSVKILSRQQTGTAIELTDAEALHVVTTYRSRMAAISSSWKRLQYEGIPALASGNGFTFGPCVFEHQAVLLPNGLRLHYHGLEFKDGEWRFTYAGIPKRLYGGKLLENIVQALARIVTMDASTRIRSAGSLSQNDSIWRVGLALQSHDELVYVPPSALVETAEGLLLQEMTRRPTWAPSLPLAAEVDHGPNYGDAK